MRFFKNAARRSRGGCFQKRRSGVVRFFKNAARRNRGGCFQKRRSGGVRFFKNAARRNRGGCFQKRRSGVVRFFKNAARSSERLRPKKLFHKKVMIATEIKVSTLTTYLATNIPGSKMITNR